MEIDPVINGFITNEVKFHFRICDNSIIIFDKRGFYVQGFQKLLMLTLYTGLENQLSIRSKPICVFLKQNDAMEDNMKINLL